MNIRAKLRYKKAMENIIMPILTGVCWGAVLICSLCMIWSWDKAKAFKVPEIGITTLLFICIGLPLLWATVPDISES